MQPIEIRPGIYWVGGIDWDLRYFHGYVTPRGSTYNSYLIMDEKIVLVDTVKHYLADEMLSRISAVVDPSKIDYMLVNHVEMDHPEVSRKSWKSPPRRKLSPRRKAREG